MGEYIDRSTFSNFGAMLIVFSAIIGIGNFSDFPMIVAENGGLAFIILYIFSSILVAIPVMVAEFYIGCKGKSGMVESFKNLTNNKFWYIVGYISVFSAIIIIAHYSGIIGWSFSYFVKAILNNLKNENIMIATDVFNNTISRPISSVIYQFLILFFCATVLWFGVRNGIEKLEKISLTLLLFCITVLVINGVQIETSREALAYLLEPDFSKITIKTFFLATRLSFFKLSIGITCLTVYASYFPKKKSLIGLSLKLVLADIIMSVLISVAIFPVLMQSGISSNTKIDFLFISVPVAFSTIKSGSYYIFLFFTSLILSSVGSLMSICEGVVSYFEKTLILSRDKSVIYSFSILFIISIFPTLSKTNLLNDFLIFNSNIFDLFNYLSYNCLLFVGAFLISLFVIYSEGFAKTKEYMIEQYAENKFLFYFWFFILKFITPLLIILLFCFNLFNLF
jgi:NSS family neurotransmitter:Na+ symporter